MQKDNPTPPEPQPWNDDSQIPDVTHPDFHEVDPNQPLPPSGDPHRRDN